MLGLSVEEVQVCILIALLNVAILKKYLLDVMCLLCHSVGVK